MPYIQPDASVTASLTTATSNNVAVTTSTSPSSSEIEQMNQMEELSKMLSLPVNSENIGTANDINNPEL